MTQYRAVDLFSGIGGFHLAATNLGMDVVLACENNQQAQRAYLANYGMLPHKDICKLRAVEIPPHDIMCAGFPCQSFSISGKRTGFGEERGVLFFEVVRLLREMDEMPRAIVMENVPFILQINKGHAIERIVAELEMLGYSVGYRILNARDFGLPQNRNRVFIVGLRDHDIEDFEWPTPVPMRPLSEFLEQDFDNFRYPTSYRWGLFRRLLVDKEQFLGDDENPRIWSEYRRCKAVSVQPYARTLVASTSCNNDMMVNGERYLTVRERLRLQGFPDSWKMVCGKVETMKQAGNAVPVPMAQGVLARVVQILDEE